MNVILSDEEIEFNRNLDPREVLHKMGFADDAIDEEGGRFRLFCPIHKDQIRRSLIIEPSENRFQCQYKTCPAHKGGLLIELLALYLDVEVAEAIRHLQGEATPEEGMIARADRLIETGAVEQAVGVLEEAVRLSPRDMVTRCKLAAAYLETGRREDGFREYLIAAEDFACKNQVEKTLSIYNILVMLSPHDVRVRRQLAYMFSRLGQTREAVEQLKWVTDRLLSRGDVQEAIKTTRQVSELCPDDPEIHMLMAKILSQGRQIGEAVASAERAAELALEAGETRLADEAVTFGLIYNPQHERLREMEAQMRTAPATADAGAGALEPASEQEDEFSNWLDSLAEEIASPEPQPAAASEPAPAAATPQPPAKESAVRRQEWISFCHDTLEGLDADKLKSMGDHLRSMFDDVQTTFQLGAVEEFELNVLKDFYTSFCRAYDDVRKGKTSDGSGSPL